MTQFQYECKSFIEKYIDERWWTVALVSAPHLDQFAFVVLDSSMRFN